MLEGPIWPTGRYLPSTALVCLLRSESVAEPGEREQEEGPNIKKKELQSSIQLLAAVERFHLVVAQITSSTAEVKGRVRLHYMMMKLQSAGQEQPSLVLKHEQKKL